MFKPGSPEWVEACRCKIEHFTDICYCLGPRREHSFVRLHRHSDCPNHPPRRLEPGIIPTSDKQIAIWWETPLDYYANSDTLVT